jgi:hypothetical protein
MDAYMRARTRAYPLDSKQIFPIGTEIAIKAVAIYSTIRITMFKNSLVLAVAALFSLNASAGYVQYNLGGPVSGYFIQRDGDQSLAYFRLAVHLPDLPTTYQFHMSLNADQQGEGSTRLTGATTYFRNNGPTNFSLYSDFGGDQFTRFNIDFARGTKGDFTYTANYGSSVYYCSPKCGFHPSAGTHNGSASKGQVDPMFARHLDDYSYEYEMNVGRRVPAFIGRGEVPEPGSLALLAVGAVGFARIRRKYQN